MLCFPVQMMFGTICYKQQYTSLAMQVFFFFFSYTQQHLYIVDFLLFSFEKRRMLRRLLRTRIIVGSMADQSMLSFRQSPTFVKLAVVSMKWGKKKFSFLSFCPYVSHITSAGEHAKKVLLWKISIPLQTKKSYEKIKGHNYIPYIPLQTKKSNPKIKGHDKRPTAN